MRKSIPGKKKYNPEFYGKLGDDEVSNQRLRDKLNYGLGHFVEKKVKDAEKEKGPEVVMLGKARCEKPGYQKPKLKSGAPGLTCKEAQAKLVSRLEKQQMQQGMEFIQDIDIRAKQICDIQKKFYATGSNNSKMTEEIVLEILNRVARGETVSQICRSPNMPSSGTVQKWIRTDPDFQKAYVEAREFQMNIFADQIIELADNSVGDIRLAFDKYGNVIPEVNYENIQRSKLRIDTRKWLMEKFYSKQYGKETQGQETQSPSKNGNVLVQIMLPDNGRPISDTKILEM